MSTTLLVLLTFCATATANVLCPNAIQIREKDVKLSVFVALVKVESSGATRGDNYEFEWWHYWVAEATIISDAPKTLKINQKCGIRLERGQQYVLGCTSFSNCHFVRPYKRLTRRERELIQKQ
ncbi:hypothetical protein ANCCEY_05208 [Ancylostoma ceylanicum]|uniref:NTR domain-containing protein n=1 Tax=Ancylostoma ceylanicum TaxID=53326 RepID=A0A0D6M034_9BILA|nr:hypothetical protein ANCCEY_05208 [Ancylostoma ceylanicum]